VVVGECGALTRFAAAEDSELFGGDGKGCSSANKNLNLSKDILPTTNRIHAKTKKHYKV